MTLLTKISRAKFSLFEADPRKPRNFSPRKFLAIRYIKLYTYVKDRLQTRPVLKPSDRFKTTPTIIHRSDRLLLRLTTRTDCKPACVIKFELPVYAVNGPQNLVTFILERYRSFALALLWPTKLSNIILERYIEASR